MPAADEDDGASLVFVLVFLLLMSVLSLSLLSVTQAHFEASGVARDVRQVEFAADAAIDLGIQEVVADPTAFLQKTRSCPFTLTAVNGVTATVNCALTGSPSGFAGSAPSTPQPIDLLSLTIPAPAGVQPGDLLIAQISAAVPFDPVRSAPPGWSPAAAHSVSGVTQVMYTRTATSSEPSSTTWYFQNSTGAAQPVVAIGGTYRYAGVGAFLGSWQQTSSTRADQNLKAGEPSQDDSTELAKDDLVLAFYSVSSTTGLEPPKRANELMAERLEHNGPALTLLGGDYVQYNNGSPGIWTSKAAVSSRYVAHLVPLKRAPGGGLANSAATFVASVDGRDLVRATVRFDGQARPALREWSVIP